MARFAQHDSAIFGYNRLALPRLQHQHGLHLSGLECLR